MVIMVIAYLVHSISYSKKLPVASILIKEKYTWIGETLKGPWALVGMQGLE